MSDIDEDYESEASESEPEELPKKKSKSSEKPSAMRLEDDADSDASSVATEDDNEETNILDSDADEDTSDIDDVDENALFADEPKKQRSKAAADANSDGEYQFGFDSEDEDNESDLEDDDGDNYLQKLDESVKHQTIANHHPELIINNYDEVEALTTVIRDARGIIIDPLHRTLPFLSKYERTRILGERAKQINDGAKAFVTTDPSVIDGYLIALAELEQQKIPFIIRRPLSNGASEYWKIKDLEMIM
jgi:DNA-directed RNA polymerase subunit K/omega